MWPLPLLHRFMELPKYLGANKGLTLIEILLAIGILGVIFGIGLPIGWDFYINCNFDSEVGTFISLLERARNSAMVNFNEASHGVWVDTDQLILFQGLSYAARDISQDRTFPRSASVIVSGPSEIVFSALSGQAASSTYNFSNATKNINIYVNSEGTILY